MNRLFLFLLVIVGASTILCSCMKEKPKPDPDPELTPNFVFISSKTELALGVNSVSQKLTLKSDTKLTINLSEPVETDPILKYQPGRIFTIDALSGQTVSDIYFGGDYVFVSYRSSVQNQYGGTVDVYSVWNAQNIYRKARISFADANIHAVCHASGRLFLACSSKNKPAFVEAITYDPEKNDEPKIKALEAVDASNLCGIATVNNKILVLADKGKTGIYVFDADPFKQNTFVAHQNPVSLISDSESDKLFLLQASPASLVELGSTGQASGGSTPLKINDSGQSKGIVVKDRIYIRSDNQMQILKSNRSDLQAPFSWQGGSSQNTLITGKNVSAMKSWLLMLGNDGTSVYFCGLRNRTEADVTEIYTVENVGQSLSLVASNENIAFIASQNGSMQILKKNTTGFPEIPVYEHNKDIIDALYATIRGLLPVDKNNLEIYSNLQVTGVNGVTAFKTTAKTQIYASIIFLYGTITNSIGYYNNGNTLPDEANKLNKTILFPNAQHSMKIGNTVYLCNEEGNPVVFETGQEIGFYMIQNGWNPNANNGYGGVNVNGSTMYSHLRYNLNNYQQQILFKLEEENPKFIFLGFKDKWPNEANYDGNMCNVVLAISDNMEGNPITKIATESIKIPVKSNP